MTVSISSDSVLEASIFSLEEAKKNIRLRINFLSAQKPGCSPDVPVVT
jgi:hypothetical protein